MTTIADFAVTTNKGDELALSEKLGKVLLVVNTASKCGFTPQYDELEELYQDYRDRGFEVLAFPCNQFGGQEPGTNEEIKEFCSMTFRVTFPMLAKTDVNGSKRHPLYALLAGRGSPFPGDIGWNFSKFLVGRDGKILKRFDSDVEPDSRTLTQAVEAALAAE